MKQSPDPVLLAVLDARLTALADEMGAVLMRTASSPNIKERRDFSCAIFDAQGNMIAQAAHIPVHLGSMAMAVEAAIKKENLAPGDMVLMNDPYAGGTHLPDCTLVAPGRLTDDGPIDFYVANRAHHADIGGMTPGSLPMSREIFQEGLRIPPLTIIRQGVLDQEILDLVLANVRGADERRGDFAAQIAANRTGIRRLAGMSASDKRRFKAGCEALFDYGERMMRELIMTIPDGEYCATDHLDGDGRRPEPIAIRCRLVIDGNRAVCDFSDSDRQTSGPVNCVRAVTVSAVSYVFRLLAPQGIPANSGCFRPIVVKTRPETVVDAIFPAPVAGGNVETSQRLVDVLLRCLSQALPDKIPAASCGTMSNLLIGGIHPQTGAFYSYYETIAGGSGGGPHAPGADAVQTHMTNTLNTPVEALEHAYPFRVQAYHVRKQSGGKGKHRGGHGLVRSIEILSPATLTLLADRHHTPPYGLHGGEPGRCGEAFLTLVNGSTEKIEAKTTIQVAAGTVVTVLTPGGGGFSEKGRC